MDKNTVAIIYDFDNTLSIKDMQEFTFIPALGFTADEFWNLCAETSHKYKMDQILTYMYLMLTLSKQKGIKISPEMMREMGKKAVFFPGVKEWFQRINKYGAELGLEVRHYIISCGLKPIIEGCEIAHEFYNIFACDFLYNESGEPVWPCMAINYTSKTQFLYRINKGVEDISDNYKLNKYMPAEERSVLFQNMVYVGDGFTDIPSMKLTRQRGGHAIGIYRNHTDASYLVDENRVDFYVKGDYREGTDMDLAMKAVLRKIAAQTQLDELAAKTKDIK